MKVFTAEQVSIFKSIQALLLNDSLDTETRTAIVSAAAAFGNYINHGIVTNMVETDELLKELSEIDAKP